MTKLIVGETVFFEGDWWVITECQWINGGRVYTLKHTSVPRILYEVREMELLG